MECPSCRRQLTADSKFCVFCGQLVSEDTGPTLPPEVDRIDDNRIRVPAGKRLSKPFEAYFAQSPNGFYLLAWASEEPGYNRKFVLIENGEVTGVLRFPQPFSARIADDGSFIFSTAAPGRIMRGALNAYDRRGRQLIHQEYDALPFNNGLSPNGRFAVFQTVDSDNSDGNTLSLFSLRDRKMLWKRHPRKGWAESYIFNLENLGLGLVYGENQIEWCDLDPGSFDITLWKDPELLRIERDRRRYQDVVAKARRELKAAKGDLEANLGHQIMRPLEEAIEQGVRHHPREYAECQALIGEIWERLDDKRMALACYERAYIVDRDMPARARLLLLREGFEIPFE